MKTKKETAKVHSDLDGFDVSIDAFGEIKSNLSIDKINDFVLSSNNYRIETCPLSKFSIGGFAQLEKRCRYEGIQVEELLEEQSSCNPGCVFILHLWFIGICKGLKHPTNDRKGWAVYEKH